MGTKKPPAFGGEYSASYQGYDTLRAAYKKALRDARLLKKPILPPKEAMPQYRGVIGQYMSNNLKPGQNTGKNGGIYREVGPRGGKTDNYSTVRDNQKMPPTQKPGNSWEPVKKTPDSKR